MTSVICVICQDNEYTEWSALPCGHVFHQACLTTWLNQDASCPQCKRRLLLSRSSAIRIYFASEDDHAEQQSPEDAAAAASAVDAQEVEQLREMLFMESQERHVAWNQVQDFEKVVAKMRSDNSREAQQLQQYSQEYENCQLRQIHVEEQMTEVMRLAALEKRENQEVINQLLLANHSVEENKAQLSQQLRSSEQENRELKTQLSALQASGNATAARLQTRQTDMERQVTQLEASVDGYKRQLELEQRNRQMEAEQLLNSAMENSQLTEELKKLKSTYAVLRRSTANEEVNVLKERNAAAQIQIRELEAKVHAATESFVRSEQEKISFTERLRSQETLIWELRTQLQRQQADQQQPTGATYWTGPPPEYEEAVTAEIQNNFSDFPVFSQAGSGQYRQLQPALPPPTQAQLQSTRAFQRSTPNLRQALEDEESINNVYASPTESHYYGSTSMGLSRAADGESDSGPNRLSKKTKAKGSRKCTQM